MSAVSEAQERGLSTRVEEVVSKFQACADAKGRYQLVMQYAQALPAYPAELRQNANRVLGCTAQVWVDAQLRPDGLVALRAASDSVLTAGLAGVLVECLSGLPPQDILHLDPATLVPRLGLGPGVLTRSRTQGLANLLEAMQRRTRRLLRDLPQFPSLLISTDGVQAQGQFAEVQAQYLQPSQQQVQQLAELLRSKQIGVVAHFYMDPQVQGVLAAAAEGWPHIHISDSLVMADAAVKMAQAGCTTIAVLGVDFMSENVRAILDEAGLQHVKVFRMSSDSIGCSLAEAAETDDYTSYLTEAAHTPRSLHVVYINTSLRTKATAHSLVPTITCTSSNVVQTVLQGFAQVPDLNVWYGPDTYMGLNLAELFTQLANLPDEEVAALHPAHTAATVKALLPRLHHYASGTCIVHHIFGGETCEVVQEAYGDAYLTAHFEVPGEMFRLAMAAKARGMGVVGSTSNILDFIAGKLQEAAQQPHGQRLRFVLGTEAGMITSIVRKVQSVLATPGRADVEVEVVFPVNPRAITTPQQQAETGGIGGQQQAAGALAGLTVLPGPAGGEGCSLEGGCASCPYMKMNSLEALLMVAQRVGDPAGEAMLERYKPRAYTETVGGRSVAQAGCEPILHMRYFSQHQQFSAALVEDILTRNQPQQQG